MSEQLRFVKVADAGHPLLSQGIALHEAGRLEEAAKVYLAILAECPRDFDATHLLGIAALQQGRFGVAQHFINAALAVNPQSAMAMGNLGTSYMRDGQLETALQWFELALKLEPTSQSALLNAGMALTNMGRYREAIPLLRSAHAQNPSSYAVCSLLGACLSKTGELGDALLMFEAACLADPDNAEGWENLAVAANALGEHQRARECADRAVTLKPDSSKAMHALGAAQYGQGRLAEAIESYRQGAALATPSAEMLFAYGNALLASGLNEEAIVQLQRAVTLDENNLNARWAIAMAHLKPVFKSESELLKSRHSFADAMDQVEKWYRTSNGVTEPFNAVGVSQPFYLAYQPFNNRELLSRYGMLCASWMSALQAALGSMGGPDAPPSRDRKLRIGIAAAHMHEHSVWNAITRGWVHHFDRSKIDLYLFQLNPTSDQETIQARQLAAHFENQPTTFHGWVEAIRSKWLDVLIYPEIGMDPLTVRLASLRLARIQAASWGHPESTGLPTIDFYLSAAAFEPQQAAQNYTEKLVTLPNLGVYVEQLAPKISKAGLSSLNLPDDEPLLLCPGAPFKYTPAFDDVWVQIAAGLKKRFLRSSSGGRLVFFRSRSDSMDRMLEARLRQAFEKGGVNFDAHVAIIPTLERSRFFGLMRRSAIMLDTLGFSGFNTALQAIECDLPVLAFEGEFMRGRLASGIMRQIGLPELVAVSKDEFVRTAVSLAGDAGTRKKLRNAIIARRPTLFQDLAPIRALEQHFVDALKTDG
jgi:predicted O-linked N-acetylglucosamine transferase (SPINDLY family)